MTEKKVNFAPYAPLKNVLEVIRRRRERGLQEIITNQTLITIGIPQGNAPRTIQALEFLKLIGEDGRQTELMEQLGKANTEEYTEVFRNIIKDAYQSVFTLVDPAQDDEVRISDAFRQFQPETQRDRMVTLFLGLCQAAAIATNLPKRRGPKPKVERLQKPSKTVPIKNKTRDSQGVSEEQFQRLDQQKQQIDYRLVSALMQQLPLDGKWTQAKRNNWILAVTAAVDLMIELTNTGGEQVNQSEAKVK